MPISSLVPAVTALLFVTLTLASGYAGSAESRWPDTRYSYFAQQQPLRDVLANLAAAHGLALIVSERIEARVSVAFTELPPEEIFRRLVGTYQLVWYHDGSALHVYRSDEMRSAILKLRSISPAQLQRSLRRLGVFDGRFPWNAEEHQGLVYFSGPPRFVTLVEQMAEQLDRRPRRRSGTVYHWTDRRGVAHFSSAPPPQAERAVRTLPTRTRPITAAAVSAGIREP